MMRLLAHLLNRIAVTGERAICAAFPSAPTATMPVPLGPERIPGDTPIYEAVVLAMHGPQLHAFAEDVQANADSELEAYLGGWRP